jgi:hypothetical protein
VVFATAFQWRGVARVDGDAAAGSVPFRIVILPGVIALWPVLAWRWRVGLGAPPAPRDAHRLAASRATGREASES